MVDDRRGHGQAYFQYGGPTIKQLLKSFILQVPGFQSLCRRLTREHVRAVMYHRFSPVDNDPRHLGAKSFARQLAYLGANHVVWTPDQHLDAVITGNADAVRPPVVVTVDDGYRDFHDVAFPLLQKYGVTAMVFVTSGFIAGHNWFWWDRLSWLLENAPDGEREWRFAKTVLRGDAGCRAMRDRLWNTIADEFRFMPDQSTEAALTQMAAQCGLTLPDDPPPQYAAMSWDQVRKLAAAGLGIGAHTVTHPILSRVNGRRARDEISGSRRALNENLEQSTDWFCYPQGGPADYTADTVAAVHEAGFRGCYTAYQNPTHDGNPLTLPRYSISGDFDHFRWVMCGAEYLFMRFKASLGGNTLPGKSYWAGHNPKKDGAAT